MEKEKTLFVLHYSPPIHGAAKVGDYIRNSSLIKNELIVKFIKIKSSQNINEIGRFTYRKLFFLLELFTKTCVLLVLFRPKIIYYTASPQGFAFYRDIIVTTPIKIYANITKAKLFYHYHARGIQEFTSQSSFKCKLTNSFVKKAHLIFISEVLKDELQQLTNYSSLYFLPNGVENKINKDEFDEIVSKRVRSDEIRVLYLSNMMKDKGYDIALNIAKYFKEIPQKIHVDFAGAWASTQDQVYFKNFVKDNKLEKHVTYHGLVQGEQKKKLFSEATLFIFPSSYKREVFPLAILEALSYGLPVLSYNIGAVAKIIHDKVGMISNEESIFKDFKTLIYDYKSERKYNICREEYLKNYTIEVFEKNLLRILKSNNA